MEMSNMRVVTALIPWDIAQKLDQLSELEGRSKAWFIRLALADYLAKVEELDQFIQEGMDAHEAMLKSQQALSGFGGVHSTV